MKEIKLGEGQLIQSEDFHSHEDGTHIRTYTLTRSELDAYFNILVKTIHADVKRTISLINSTKFYIKDRFFWQSLSKKGGVVAQVEMITRDTKFQDHHVYLFVIKILPEPDPEEVTDEDTRKEDSEDDA